MSSLNNTGGYSADSWPPQLVMQRGSSFWKDFPAGFDLDNPVCPVWPGGEAPAVMPGAGQKTDDGTCPHVRRVLDMLTANGLCYERTYERPNGPTVQE